MLFDMPGYMVIGINELMWRSGLYNRDVWHALIESHKKQDVYHGCEVKEVWVDRV